MMTSNTNETAPAPCMNARYLFKNKNILVSEWALYIATFVVVLVLGAINLYQPFTGDTALFMVGAEAMHRGEILYVDFWDNKQPGIYVFYYLAGSLFGFSEQGVHLFEMAWWAAFSIVCFLMLRRYFTHAWLSAAVPLVMLSVYYAHLTPWIDAQVESLVGFPVLVSILLLGRSYGSGRGAAWGFGLAGVFGAISMAFKLVLAPMFIVFVLVAAAERTRSARPANTVRSAARLWLGFALGVAIVFSAICLAFLAAGGLDQFIWTTFVYPLKALAGTDGAPLDRLVHSVSWYVAAFAPWLPFVGLAAARSFRAGEPALTRLMWAWLIAGVAVILMQRFSWWTYHMPLLFPPTAVLAVRGVDMSLTWLGEHAGTEPRPRAVACALLLLPALAASAFPTLDKAGKLLSAYRDPVKGIAGYRNHCEEYNQAVRIADMVNWDDALPGRIYVLGTPLVYLVSNRQQALPVNGWAWGFFLPEQWRALPDELIRRRPAYVYVNALNRWLIGKHNPKVGAVLDQYYTVVAESGEGRWYRLTTP